MEKIGWTITETVGVGIINARALKPQPKGWIRLYRDILKFGHAVKIAEQSEDIIILETRKPGHSYWTCMHRLTPEKEVEQI